MSYGTVGLRIAAGIQTRYHSLCHSLRLRNIHLKHFQLHDSRSSASVDQYAACVESVETRQRLEAKAKAMAASRHEYDDVGDSVGSGTVATAYHVIDSDEEDSVDPFELYKMQKAEAAAVRWQ
eukprot:SAG31_NODE_10827_length_1093_cov_0.996982_2_plen_123_part_00